MVFYYLLSSAFSSLVNRNISSSVQEVQKREKMGSNSAEDVQRTVERLQEELRREKAMQHNMEQTLQQNLQKEVTCGV